MAVAKPRVDRGHARTAQPRDASSAQLRVLLAMVRRKCYPALAEHGVGGVGGVESGFMESETSSISAPPVPEGPGLAKPCKSWVGVGHPAESLRRLPGRISLHPARCGVGGVGAIHKTLQKMGRCDTQRGVEPGLAESSATPMDEFA